MIILIDDKNITFTYDSDAANIIIGMVGDYRLWLKYTDDISVPPIYGISKKGASIWCTKNNKHPADITQYTDKLKEILS